MLIDNYSVHFNGEPAMQVMIGMWDVFKEISEYALARYTARRYFWLISSCTRLEFGLIFTSRHLIKVISKRGWMKYC